MGMFSSLQLYFPRKSGPDVGSAQERCEHAVIERITFDLSGWHEHERSPKRIVWGNAGNIMSLDVVPAPSVIKSMEREVWLADARSMARPGGIVSVDAYNISSHPAIQIIYKRIHETGYMYTGMLIFGLAEYWCQVTVVCLEHGTIGLREAVLTVKLLKEGKIRIRKHPFYLRPFKRSSGYLEGWFQDPYNPKYRGGSLRSITDNEEYDTQFPDHPLSQVRSTLKTVRDSLRVAT